MGILHPIQRKSLLFLFILSVCFLTISQCALQARVAQAREITGPQEPRALPGPQQSPSPTPEWKPKTPSIFRRILHYYLTCNKHKRIKEQELFRTGPQLPRSYNTSNFSFPALVQGGWPAVIVYELPMQSSVTITIEVKDAEPFGQKFAGTGGQKEMMFTLPERFGKKPQAALISIKAFPDNPREKKPADLLLHALGMGDEAVGSVPIDIKVTPPGRINTARKGQLNYEYRSSKFFNAVKSDFWLSKVSKGRHRSYWAGSRELGTLQEDLWKPGEWNGRNNVGKFSIGAHYLSLTALTSKGPWLLKRSTTFFVD